MLLNLATLGLGYILGDFFTKKSGHPALGSHLGSGRSAEKIKMYQ
jgi:hypothetical protein